MNDYELPALPDKDCPYGYSEVCLTEYARAAIAPLLQDLAAHEASNRIKTENLETLRERVAELEAILRDSITAFEEINGASEADLDLCELSANAARAALGESNHDAI